MFVTELFSLTIQQVQFGDSNEGSHIYSPELHVITSHLDLFPRMGSDKISSSLSRRNPVNVRLRTFVRGSSQDTLLGVRALLHPTAQA